MNSFYNEAGSRIRNLREINRFTRERFAEIADISPKFLYEIETGQKGFSADTLYRIAKALSVSCEYILTGDEQGDCSEEALTALKLFNNPQIGTVSQILKLIYELNTKCNK
jgi:transcriptional regulator with XRE-family HTH domain